jgi:hypothetical protein
VREILELLLGKLRLDRLIKTLTRAVTPSWFPTRKARRDLSQRERWKAKSNFYKRPNSRAYRE